MRAIIVDDEPPARDYLKLLLARIGGVEVVGEADEASGCIELVKATSPDVVFLDIRLPGMSGVELGQIIGAHEPAPKVVFVTGFDEYAARAFDMDAADYITKPFNQDRLQKTIDRLSASMNIRKSQPSPLSGTKLSIKHEDGWKLIDLNDILFAKTEGRKVRIQTTGESYLSQYTIGELEEELEAAGFFRANEGCLVNLKRIREVVTYGPRNYELLLDDPNETYVPLSRSKAQKLRELLGLH